MLKKDWNVAVIAIVSDTSGESRKARKSLGEKYKWLVVIDCYAHQVHCSF